MIQKTENTSPLTHRHAHIYAHAHNANGTQLDIGNAYIFRLPLSRVTDFWCDTIYFRKMIHHFSDLLPIRPIRTIPTDRHTILAFSIVQCSSNFINNNFPIDCIYLFEHFLPFSLYLQVRTQHLYIQPKGA